jgi:hypothetical protein
MSSSNVPKRDYSLEILLEIEEALKPIEEFLSSPEALSDQSSHYKLLYSIQRINEFIAREKQTISDTPKPKANLTRYEKYSYMPNTSQSLPKRLSDAIKLILGIH